MARMCYGSLTHMARIPSYGKQSVGGEDTEGVHSHISQLGTEEMVLDTRAGKC